MVRNMTRFYAEQLLVHRLTPKLEDLTLSTVRDFFLSILNRKHDYHRKNIGNRSFESVEHSGYSRTTGTNHCFHGKIRANGTSGMFAITRCRILSSSLLSKCIKIKVYSTIILLLILYRCETWSLIFSEGDRLRVFENRILGLRRTR
jgi:hypothetical protein